MLQKGILTEMNAIIESLYQRKSVRAYEDRDIPEEMRNLILESAMQAPSAGCQQLYTILNITDQGLKERLAESCDHQPFIAKAPMVLVFCADCKKWYDAYEEAGCTPRLPGVGDLMLAVTDTAIAAQNAVVAAESLGIGSCYIGDIVENFEIHKELLNLPPQVAPLCMLVFGYPTQQQKERKQTTRFAKSSIVFENRYRELSEEELLEMMPNDRTKAFYNRKYVSDFAQEMVRSTKEIYKNWNSKE